MTDFPENSWKDVLADEFRQEYFAVLAASVRVAYQSGLCHPPEPCIFEAFRLCSFEDVKVVIVGQDPYHGPSQAHGLSFSVNDGVKFPPSLRNIFKEIQDDTGTEIPFSGNLGRWASQGVLLLNTTLTVAQGRAGSHKGMGWERFTDAVIDAISVQKKHVVFMLWGGPARKKGRGIDRTRHLVLESGHPSPLSAIRGHWFGNRQFSRANQYLREKGKTPVIW